MSKGRNVKGKWIVFNIWFNGFSHSTLPIRQMRSSDRRRIKEIGMKKFLEQFDLGWDRTTVDIINV